MHTIFTDGFGGMIQAKEQSVFLNNRRERLDYGRDNKI
jgi:hypothetical protein